MNFPIIGVAGQGYRKLYGKSEINIKPLVYRLVTERELFVRVKREPADPNVPWMIHGVAGFVEDEK